MFSNQVLSVILIACGIFSVTIAMDCGDEVRDYDGYSLLRLHPRSMHQLEKLRNMMKNAGEESGWMQFWTKPTGLNRSVDILIDPEYKEILVHELRRLELPHKVAIEDMGEAIRESSPSQGLTRSMMSENSTLRAEYFAADMYHRQYHPYVEIETKLRDLQRMDSRVSLEVIGSSTEGRNIYLVKVSSSPGANKPVVLLDAGHHAREWLSHATLMYILESLVNIDVPRLTANSCKTERCRKLVSTRTKLDLDKYDYWFIPTVNPDGYEYTHTTDRLWRKTRSGGYCKGTDPNRNYPFHWREAGASQYACSDIYAGPKPLSEPEAQAVAGVMDQNKGRLVMYISLHCYSQLLLSPYGYGRVYPDNYAQMEKVANAWIRSVADLRNTDYQFGPSAVLLYPAAGGSDDYAHGVAKIKYAYTIELPDKGSRGFVMPPSEIIPTGHEAVIGLKSMIDTMESIQ